jgi:predicted dehydrogenase
MAGRGKVRIGVVGLDHVHGLVLAFRLRQAGATILAHHSSGAQNRLAMRLLGPRAKARTPEEIIDDPDIDLIVTAAVPSERGPIAVAALRAGKHVVADKPGVTTLDGLTDLDLAVAESGKRWWVMFGERFENRAVGEACRRARLGDIGRVVSVLGLGPHRMGADGRPDWFWEPSATGGILVDIGSHQADQFLTATGAASADVLSSAVGNVASPAHPRMEDIGMMVLAADGAVGTHRVDYLSPKGLKTWGDGRLMIVGTDGTLEVRTNVDVAGKRGKEHLIATDHKGVHRIDCGGRPVDWARRIVADIADGSDTFATHDHIRAVCDVTLRAQAAAGPWPATAEAPAAAATPATADETPGTATPATATAATADASGSDAP